MLPPNTYTLHLKVYYMHDIICTTQLSAVPLFIINTGSFIDGSYFFILIIYIPKQFPLDGATWEDVLFYKIFI